MMWHSNQIITMMDEILDDHHDDKRWINFHQIFWNVFEKNQVFKLYWPIELFFFYEWEPTKIINYFSDFCSTIKWINQNEFYFSYIIHTVFWIVWWWQWSYTWPRSVLFFKQNSITNHHFYHHFFLDDKSFHFLLFQFSSFVIYSIYLIPFLFLFCFTNIMF